MSTPSRPSYSHFGLEQIDLMETITSFPALQLIEQSAILSSPSSELSKLPTEKEVKVMVGDVEPKMVEMAMGRVEKEGWKNVGDEGGGWAGHWTSPTLSVDYVFVNCALQLFPRPEEGLKEAFHTLKTAAALTQYGFTDVRVEPVLVERTFPSPEEAFRPMSEGAPMLFRNKEVRRKMVERLREKYGEGETTLRWEGNTITARKA
ncbi:hypothetical protein JCM8547_000400 [Rhodosporidiobolus lusitaniae]